MAEMQKNYDPSGLEDRIYNSWLNRGYFKATRNPDKTPYTIVIPPPNVTGILHMGHVLDNTLQDVYIRWHKLKGFETCWVPGTDHASIATESKVVARLAKEGITKEELGREKFLAEAWKWKDEHGGIIINQLKKLGCACDWDRERFTMDDDYYKLVIKTFVDLHKKGLIYKGHRLVNWCPKSKSVISDEEVYFEEKNGKLWYFRYPVKDSKEQIVIATTRPETMFGDTAIAVHPENEKLKHLIGKTAILPFMNREIPVVADTYADPEKGTGAVKITPAHDPNDYELGKRHDLPAINIMNEDATLNHEVPEEFRGMERFAARKLVVQRMEEMGLVEKIQDYTNQISLSERGKVPIEYRLSEQWYISMQKLTEPALEVVRNGEIKIHPERWTKTYYHWLENVQDWCISRQLWWGHRIPAYYCDHEGCEDVMMVSEEAPTKCTKCGQSDKLRQEEDVLDTWASSWLWPYGVHRTKEDEDYFYPTDLLVTGPDIIFFWVARMIMAGLEYKKQIPFKDVYFHGLVRDEKGRKMSKSLGNSPDPLDLMAKYGSDALRFTMIRLTPTGNDVLFSEDKVELGRNFANKIWNASRFMNMQRENAGIAEVKPVRHLEKLEDKWIVSRLHHTIEAAEHYIKGYHPNEAVKKVYEFLWNDLCDWYLEMAKARMLSDDLAEKQAVLENTAYVFEAGLKLLHPFMPFITEEIWQANYATDATKQSIMTETMEELDNSLINAELEATIENIKEIVSKLRNVRAENNIAPAKELKLLAKTTDQHLQNTADVIKFLAKISEIEFNENVAQPELAAGFVCGGHEFFIPLADFIDPAKEVAKIEKEISRLSGINKGVEKKLSNERFVANAPEAVIAKEKEKLTNNLDAIAKLEKQLEIYKK